MSVSFLHCNDVLSLVINGSVREVRNSHVNYKRVLAGLAEGLDGENLLELVDAKEPVVEDKDVKINSDLEMFCDGERVDQVLVNEIAKLKDMGLPYEGMTKFIANLYKNVSSRVRTELLAFVQRNGLTVDTNGHILAYKAVNSSYMDKHTRSISNAPGNEVKMKRALVDDNFDIGCSKGLHAGSLDYIYSFGGGNDRIVIVKIDPEDVVCIPKDCNCKKMRVCRYIVVGDYQGELKRGTYDSDWSTDDMYDADDELNYDEDEDDFDWDTVDHLDGCDYNEDEDDDFYDEEADDIYDQSDIEVNCVKPQSECCQNNKSLYGIKPNNSSQAGRKFYNKRDGNGRFA